MNEKALKPSHPDVDRLICKKGKKIVNDYRFKLNGELLEKGVVRGHDCSGTLTTWHNNYLAVSDPGLSAGTSGREQGKWPNISKTKDWDITEMEQRLVAVEKQQGNTWRRELRTVKITSDASSQVAREITDMGSGDKAIVAGFLAKTVEGGEVLEMRYVDSTSAVVNVCYDASLGRFGVAPYACVGFGGNFVDVRVVI